MGSWVAWAVLLFVCAVFLHGIEGRNGYRYSLQREAPGGERAECKQKDSVAVKNRARSFGVAKAGKGSSMGWASKRR